MEDLKDTNQHEPHDGDVPLSAELPRRGLSTHPDAASVGHGSPEPGLARPNRYLTHAPLKYGKKFYVGEFIAERTIQFIAFVSIAVILAIFFYVFKEASFAFRSPEAAAGSEISQRQSAEGTEQLQPQAYTSDEPLQPQSYGGEEGGATEPGGVRQEGEKTALELGREASQSVESAGGEKAVTVRELVAPNDIIDNEPAYIWQPISGVPKYSFIPLVVGALKVTLIGIFIAAPIAILAALFTTSFAPRWMKEVMKPAIEILAGFPSVVIGFFCLMTLASLIQTITGAPYRLNAFVGGIGMALAVIPIVFTVTEDAFSAVPRYMKEASIALGASRWQTAYRVVLPAATPGVFAALILGFGRAFGETMIALMATGNAALVSGDIFESVRTMSATIGAEMAEVEFHGVHYGVLFLIGAILFVVTFSLNAIAEFYVRKKLIKRFQGN